MIVGSFKIIQDSSRKSKSFLELYGSGGKNISHFWDFLRWKWGTNALVSCWGESLKDHGGHMFCSVFLVPIGSGLVVLRGTPSPFWGEQCKGQAFRVFPKDPFLFAPLSLPLLSLLWLFHPGTRKIGECVPCKTHGGGPISHVHVWLQLW